jgi:hypothetical protein
VTPAPPSGAFPHQHDDPRGLVERIEAQLRDRIAEALDMAGLNLMVDLRQHQSRPAPETSSDADRREFEQIVADLLTHVRDALYVEIAADERAELERAEAAQPKPAEKLLAGQVLLARRLPDYWQRFETHVASYGKARLDMPGPGSGWLSRLFGR